MDCLKFAEMLDNYANLNEEQIAELEEHTMNCEQCRSELEFFRSVIDAAASLPTIEPPEDLLTRINSEIDKQYSDPRTRVFNNIVSHVRVNIRRYATAAACLLVGVVVGLNGKMISDRLSGNDGSGIISEQVSTADNSGAAKSEQPSAEPVPQQPEAEQPSAQTEVESKVEAAAAAPDGTAEQQGRAESVRQTPSAAKSVQTPASVSTERNVPSAAATNTPAAVHTAAPASTEVATEPAQSKADTEKYVITQEYHLPEEYAHSGETETPDEITEQPGVESYSLASGEQEAEFSYAEEKETARASVQTNPDQLIIESGSVDVVVTMLNELGVENSGVAYVTSTGTFYTLLDRLETAGITYSYIQNGSGDKVSFKIILI